MPISFYEARQTILEAVTRLAVERVPLLEAAGRAAAEDISATLPLPAFNNSAMDGYAVRAASCPQGSTLEVTGFLSAGHNFASPVPPGMAVKIMTGAPLPAGTDAVIPLEDCDAGEQTITLRHQVKQGDHIRWTGEDIQPGDRVLAAGTLLRPSEINLLAALRMAAVPVHRRARVAILATGDELQEIDELYFAGSIVNSNSWGLAAAVKEIGAIPLMLGIARDNPTSLKEKIRAGLQSDVLITSAGVSTGDRDLVRETLAESGVKEHFWKIRIRPGHPTAFGMQGHIPVFSLPGNPVSTMLVFEELVRPALLKMMGYRDVLRTVHKATLTEAISKKPGRVQMLRVALRINPEGELLAASAGKQQTGIYQTLVAAQGIALLPEDQERFAAGEKIDVHFLGASTAMGS